MTDEERARLIQRFSEALDEYDPAIVTVAMLSEEGDYILFENNWNTDRPTVYQAIGLLEQAKLNLLASVPVNRPLREPAPEQDGADEPPKGAIGQA